MKELIKNVKRVCNMIFHRILLSKYDKFQRIYWDSRAEGIYEKWGKSSHDWEVLSLLIDRYKPSSILDVGCGSGRLFGLYQAKNINDVISIDISEKALKLANIDFPHVKTMRMKTEDMNFGYNRFELAICNRTLQHIPKQNIDTVIKKICSSSWMVYINELASSDGVPESKDMFKQDYQSMLNKNGFRLCEEGNIGKQTWLLFSKKEEMTNEDK